MRSQNYVLIKQKKKKIFIFDFLYKVVGVWNSQHLSCIFFKEM